MKTILTIGFWNYSRLRRWGITILSVLLFQLGSPLYSLALSGGPSQPEVQSFAPIGVSDMVDIFSGDFSYNIPLLDVEGYPINLAYSAGISADQEASWVGLGWNINAGVVNRNLRGLPDDFNGDNVQVNSNVKDRISYGVTAGASFNWEAFGKKLGLGVSTALGIQYNNYIGYSASFSVTPSLGPGQKGSLPLNGSLGISGNSAEGASIQPQISYSFTLASNSQYYWSEKSSLGISFGGAFNSRGGLSGLSLKANVSVSNSIGFDSHVFYRNSAQYGNVSAGTWNFTAPTFTPPAEMSSRNVGFSGKFSAGVAAVGTYSGGFIQGFRARNYQPDKYKSTPAYGYLFSHENNSLEALHDFNRENEAPYSESTPALSIPNYTYDLFSVVAQGTGGSYRPMRSDMGTLYKPRMEGRPDQDYNLEVELGFGLGAHVGGAIGYTEVQSESRLWNNDNESAGLLNWSSSLPSNLKYEPFYFKEANEKNVDDEFEILAENGGFEPVQVALNNRGDYNVSGGNYWKNGSFEQTIQRTKRQKRQKRNQLFTFLSNKEAKDFGVQNEAIYAIHPGHHIGEITTLSPDGSRYIFGLPLYVNYHSDVSFAIGDAANDVGSGTMGDHRDGLVAYTGNDNSVNNSRGRDNYFNETILPSYAHSHMLTCILSSDYVDSESSDLTRGPSDGDLGNWTKFSYERVPGYQYRVPFEEKKASWNEGLLVDKSDDRASYTHGEKDLAYLKEIETKNYIAIFRLSEREDGCGVVDKNGGINGAVQMRKIDRIELYSKAEYLSGTEANPAIPIKTVHFEYTYELCQGLPNSLIVDGEGNRGGKLTLKKIYFTYRNSNKAKFSGYEFEYGTSDDNPKYNLKAYDRWGNYKPNDATQFNSPVSPTMTNSENPYTIQDRTVSDVYAAVWCLREIKLPSGGSIKVHYEADDYMHVQNKLAQQMYKIIGSELSGIPSSLAPSDIELSSDNTKNSKLYIELPLDENGNIIGQVSDYNAVVGSNVFIKSLVKYFTKSGDPFYEYVPSYYEVKEFSFGQIGTTKCGILELDPNSITDNSAREFNPITIAGLQFGRMSLSKYLLEGQAPGNGDFKNVLIAIGNSFASFRELFKQPNKILYDANCARNILSQKSMVRLNHVKNGKLGGGHRVKKIEILDNWAEMTDDKGRNMTYGQEYLYQETNGKSSGVASYEPQIGGEENPWKQPIFSSEERKGVPDNRFFAEEPLGEAFFPGASVGYSRVIVKNLGRPNVTKNATGYVEHNFYTSKEFPTIATRTEKEYVRDKQSAVSIRSLLNFTTKDFVTVTQGFSVELNDMSGKQKSQKVFNEYGVEISSVEYKYQCTPLADGTFRLSNEVDVIHKTGQKSRAAVGVYYDIINDAQEQMTDTKGADISGNIDMIVIPLIAFPVPSVWPSFNREITKFRFQSTAKVIQRFGILTETIARENGSTVKTKNLAYDAETGEVLLTEVDTNFSNYEDENGEGQAVTDKIYTLNFPAHWKYPQMGGAYQNIGIKMTMGFDAEGKFLILNARNYFVEGDELSLVRNNEKIRGWVYEVNESSIKVIDRTGNPVVGAGYAAKIIRSGYRNMQQGMMATITAKTNPIDAITSGSYKDVLQASAIEYVNNWRTSCDCFEGEDALTTTNPYILGITGYWKPTKNYLHLSERNQTDVNGNSNLRKDGLMTSFRPFYYVDAAGNWAIDYNDWTYTSEITEFSPYGQELENRDALGRYSAARFGYNQTLATAVAANSRYREMGYESFEYSDSPACGDSDFELIEGTANASDEQSHTGKYSLKITGPGTSVRTGAIPDCIESDCPLSLVIEQPAIGGPHSIVAPTCSSDLTFSWSIISGNAEIQMISANTLSVSGSVYTIEVTVSNSEGDSYTAIFSH